MAKSKAFISAMRIAKSSPNLDIGCHVVLVDGGPLAPAEEVSSLLVPRKGVFRTGFAEFALAAMQNKLSPDHIYREAAVQMEHIQKDAGIRLTHFDTHKH